MLGKTLGPFRLDEQLGAGGMGTVYRATAASATRAVAQGTVVAVKVLHSRLLEREGSFKRFLREAELGKSIRHKNVVRTLDVDAITVDGGQAHYLVLEYVEGQSLRELLDEMGCVPEVLCRTLAVGVAAGLGALHAAGIVHRDLKPSNVLVTSDHQVKLMDLGIARRVDPTTDISESGAFVGSLRYAAPEQFGTEPSGIDGRVDLHALGVVLYELATGRHPFPDGEFHQIVHGILHETPRPAGSVNPQLSAFFEELVQRLLAKSRDERFRSADELLRALEQGEAGTWWTHRASALQAETRRPLRRIRIPRETALYGRDEELARLRSLYDRAAGGQGQVLLLHGEAGIGKTRLVDELVGRLQDDGEDVNFLFGSYPPAGAATDTGAFCTAFREQLGSAGLESALRSYLTDVPALVPAFAALLRGEPPPRDTEPLTKDSLQTVFAAVTQRLAEERTTIVLIDDLHFASREGRALFLALALAVAEHRVMLVGTTRHAASDEWGASLDRLPYATRMEMKRLGPSDLSRLLVDAFGSERLASTLALQVAESSDGNPYFVFEILRSLRETQRLRRRDDGSWATTSVLERIDLPDNLRDLVLARLSELDEPDRDLLEMASCLGFEFDPLLVARATGMPEIPVLKRLGRIEHDHRLVRAVGRRCIFDHHQVREVLYESLSELLRERYHAVLGEAYERLAAPVEGARAVEVCQHFVKGACAARALPYLDEALAHLDAGHLSEPASELALRVLAVPGLIEGVERVELQLRACTWLERLGESETERAVLEEALGIARGLGDRGLIARTQVELGRYHQQRAAHEAAETALRAVLEQLDDGDLPAIRSRAQRLLGHALRSTGRPEEARTLYDQALAYARSAGDAANEARCLGSIGVLLNRQGDRRGAVAAFEADIAICRRIGAKSSEARALGSLGNVFTNLGQSDRARECFQGNLRLAREIGDRRGTFIARYNLAFLEYDNDRLDEARDLFEEGLVLAREIDYRDGESAVLATLGMCYASMGRMGEAIDVLRRSGTIAAEMGKATAEAIAHLNLVSVFTRLGAHDEARACAESAVAKAREGRDPRVTSYALHNCARLHATLGEPEQAVELMSQAVEIRREIEQLDALPASLSALGEFLTSLDRPDEARPLLEEALRLAEKLGQESVRREAVARLAALGDAAALAALRGEEDGHDAADAAAGDSPSERVPDALEHHQRVWKATGDERHLRAAHRALLTLIERAPARYRRTIVENVPANAAVMAAVAELDGPAPSSAPPGSRPE